GGHVVSARLADFVGFSAPAVYEMVHRLEREGLVSLGGHKEVHLTKAGKTQADSVVRRHRLAERFLVEVLGFEWWKTHEEAERLEHAMSPEMEARIARVLGDPQTCPHGNPMPGVTAAPTRPLDALGRGAVRPGANASGKTRDEAIANARKAFRAYRDLLEARGVSVERCKDIDPANLPVEDAPPTGLFPGEDTPLQEHEIRDFLHQFE